MRSNDSLESMLGKLRYQTTADGRRANASRISSMQWMNHTSTLRH